MTYTFVQSEKKSEASAVDMPISLGSAPVDGSALIIGAACRSNNGITGVVQTGATWNLLYEDDGPILADQLNGVLVRCQIWGAFNVSGASADLTVSFSGGTTNRGFIVAEYSGDVFEFPNPADRVKSNSGTTGAGAGTASMAAGGQVREDAELWIGVAATDQAIIWTPTAPNIERAQVAIGAAGRIILMDLLTTSKGDAITSRATHSDPGGATPWVIAAVAIRGDTQVPVEATDIPAVSEPVTEQDDYSSDGIAKLASQYRARA